ncbi:MAG: heavy metal-associated domain-containing protein [Desulfuromonadales bacterium]|jgi:copper chaperone CopZ
MKLRIVVFTGFLLLLVVAGALALAAEKDQGNSSLAEFSVRNLTCVACVGNIEKALADLPGVGSPQVSLSEGRMRVEYDAAQVNAGNIAEAVSAAGYPTALLGNAGAAMATGASSPGNSPGCACCNRQ